MAAISAHGPMLGKVLVDVSTLTADYEPGDFFTITAQAAGDIKYNDAHGQRVHRDVHGWPSGRSGRTRQRYDRADEVQQGLYVWQRGGLLCRLSARNDPAKRGVPVPLCQ